MVKFIEVSEKIENLFFEVRDKTFIPSWVEFKIIGNNKQKIICKIVKANELVQLLTEGLNFVIIVNENALLELPDNMIKIVFDEILAGVFVSDSDVISIEKPDFNTYTGLLTKYGDSEIIKLHESIKSIYDMIKQKEDESKSIGKGKRGRKKKM